MDRLTIAAIAVVVALVSIPRLKGLALLENERDASHTLRVLAATLVSAVPQLSDVGLAGPPASLMGVEAVPASASTSPSSPFTPLTIGDLFHSRPSVARSLEDAEILAGGRLLRRHGYLFDLTIQNGEPILRAWPWCYGETGLGAFCYVRGEGVVGHPNEEPRWCGPDRAPPIADSLAAAGWLLVE